ncbi:RHS protein [Escherichia coli H489]|nr:RHS repeat-associated core domain-containing protein [Escherichia coli]EGB58721.1 RHS protein [Escherichia coli H489]
MSGKPAARQGDMTQYGGSIVQGSAGVRIGAPTGVACSVCPGGVTSGHPVNPLLGAKVLPGETDIALPAPLPFILSRTYSSYRTKTPAPVGSLGPGWKMPADIRLQLRDNTLILSDNGGRSLYFEHLFPGEDGYRYDRHGRLTEKTDLIPEGVIRTDDERTHQYHYDSQHRLVHYTRTQYAEPLVESRYLYDPLGRRVAKRVWRRERDLTGWMSLSRKPEVTWYGWEGDRLTTIQNDRTRIQTIYQPGSFTPLIRVETATGELAKTQRRSLADTLQQSGGEDGGSVVFPPVLVQMLDRLESEILADRVSEESRRWLASCGLTVAQMQNQMDPVYTPARKIHLYHCDHRGLPLALVSTEGATEWCAEYDEWGNLLNEENPHQLQQLIRLPGQQYDEESGLYYNRHRYYDPLQGRYITQDPIGLKGGWNFYQYPLNPVQYIDSMGLASKYGHLNNGGYGARPNKPPTPDPSKLPDIAKQLRLPYPIDQASSAPNVFKTFFRALSPYDYTLYCRKWVKPNLTCTPQDDSQYPGMDTKTASDYLPQTNWPTTQLPPGYTCAEPYLFPDINKPDGPATAGIDDLGEILAKMKQRTSRGIRK